MKDSLLNILPLTDGFHYYVTYKDGDYIVQIAKYSNLDFGKAEIVYDSSMHYTIECEDIDSPIGYLQERTLSDWDFKNGNAWRTFDDYKSAKIERWLIKEMQNKEVDE